MSASKQRSGAPLLSFENCDEKRAVNPVRWRGILKAYSACGEFAGRGRIFEERPKGSRLIDNATLSAG
jgi:hypothetical protein